MGEGREKKVSAAPNVEQATGVPEVATGGSFLLLELNLAGKLPARPPHPPEKMRLPVLSGPTPNPKMWAHSWDLNVCDPERAGTGQGTPQATSHPPGAGPPRPPQILPPGPPAAPPPIPCRTYFGAKSRGKRALHLKLRGFATQRLLAETSFKKKKKKTKHF